MKTCACCNNDCHAELLQLKETAAKEQAERPLDAASCSLLPCPFCGSSPRVYEVVDTYRQMMSCGWVVRCLNPECLIRPHTTEDASRDVAEGWWNRRANADVQPPMRKESQ
jgi:hypothetical protein